MAEYSTVSADDKLIKEATKALMELEAAAKKAEKALNRLGFKLLEDNDVNS